MNIDKSLSDLKTKVEHLIKKELKEKLTLKRKSFPKDLKNLKKEFQMKLSNENN